MIGPLAEVFKQALVRGAGMAIGTTVVGGAVALGKKLYDNSKQPSVGTYDCKSCGCVFHGVPGTRGQCPRCHHVYDLN